MIPPLLLAVTAVVVAAAAGLGLLLRSLPRPVPRASSRPVAPRRGPPPPVDLVLPPGEEGHLAAALAFQQAADRYVAMCERRVAEARYWRGASSVT